MVSRANKSVATAGSLIVLVIGVGAWWWSNNGAALLGDLRRQGKESILAGEARGRVTSPTGCIQSAVASGRECSSTDVLCEAKARAFLNGCLSTTQDLAKFCVTLPHYEDRVRRLSWAVDFCANDGEANERCARITNEASVFCAKRSTRSNDT